MLAEKTFRELVFFDVAIFNDHADGDLRTGVERDNAGTSIRNRPFADIRDSRAHECVRGNVVDCVLQRLVPVIAVHIDDC